MRPRRLRAGADGLLLDHVALDVLLDAILTVARGEALLALLITRRVIEAFADVPSRAATGGARA